jgi:hypothetical protein
MPSQGLLTLTGKSKSTYTFEIYPYGTPFNEVASVYVISRSYLKVGTVFHSIIYVGQTDNLKERFLNHHKEYCFNLNAANSICVYRSDSEASRLSIESDLIAAYNPPCNG